MVRDIIRLAVCPLTFALLLAGAGPIAGCTSLEPFTAATGDPSGNLEHTGSIGFDLDVGSGVTLNSVGYAISGNGFTKDGDVDISQSPTLTAVIGGIPAGDGFTITITATSPDGSVICIGTATFSVMEGVITQVTIHLQCRIGHRFGKIDINGDVNVCPAIDDVTAAPIETAVGGTITLRTRISDSDGPTSALESIFGDGTTSLTLHGRDTSAIALTCTAPGPAHITLSVSDGECLQATAVDVTCTGTGGGSQAVWTWQQLDATP